MSLPFVSIIVPAYNEEKFIGDCLQSLVNLDYPKENYEILLVDNNCSDKTIDIAKEFPVKIIKEEKQGVTYARIGGIKASSGEIIAFVDADSIMQKTCLSKMIEVYETNKKVVAVSQLIDLQPKNFFITLCEMGANIGIFTLKILPGCHFSFKREAYNMCGGYSEKIQYGEDIFISKKIRKVGKIVILKKGLVSTSSRRYQTVKSAVEYISKTLISGITIFVLDRSFFFLKKVNL